MPGSLSEFKDYKLGINLSKSDKQLSPGELLTATNWKYSDFGSLKTREGVKTVMNAALGSSKYPKHIAYVPGSTNYIYVVADDYKLYKLTGSEPSLAYNASLGTLEGDATIVPFNGYGIVLDGGYIKTVQGDTLALAYDDGDGDSGFQYTNHCGENDDDASTELYSGSVVLCGSKIETQAWDSGYTIPLTRIEIWLSKTEEPTGDITAYIYDDDGSNLLATSSTTIDASNLTTNGTKQEFTFASDATQAMASETEYIFCIGYSGGDASNYITVHATDVDSGGKQYQNSGSWSSDSTKSPLIGVKPGRPPKGSFGDVKDNRLFVAGDPDNPGYMWFGNVGSAFDWSTVDGGGWVGAVDDNANDYAVGGIVAHYGDLYVLGKKAQPYLCKLTGSLPSEFSLPPMFQQISTDHKCLISVTNDIWFTSENAVNALSGVQEYGDLRAFSEGDPIKNKIRDNFDSDAFAGYNPGDGQYILQLSGYDNIFVCHTKHIVEVDGRRRFPWTEYKFKNLSPSAFKSFNNKFYIGCTDGNIYILDSDMVEDAETLPDYILKPGVTEMPFRKAMFKGYFLQIDSNSWSLDNKTDISFDNASSEIRSVVERLETVGGEYIRDADNEIIIIGDSQVDFQVASLGEGVKFRVSGSESNDGVFTVSSTNTTTSVITVDEAVTDETAGATISISLDYGSLTFYKNGSETVVTKIITANNSPRREQIRFNAKSFQWSIHDLTLSSPMNFNGLSLLGDSLGATI